MIDPDVDARAKLIGTPDEGVSINGADNAWFLISYVSADVIPYANDENMECLLYWWLLFLLPAFSQFCFPYIELRMKNSKK